MARSTVRRARSSVPSEECRCQRNSGRSVASSCYHPVRPMPEEPLLPPLTVEELSAVSSFPPALIRLAIDCGCPTNTDGRLTQCEFGWWLAEHYNDVRAAAGLPLLPEVTAQSEDEREFQRLNNSMRTIADYCASRSSDPAFKEAWLRTSRSISRF